MIALMATAGLAEGFGVLAILPVLELTADGSAPAEGPAGFVVGILDSVGLEPTVSVLLGFIFLAITVKAALIWMAEQQIGFAVAQAITDLRLHLLERLMKARLRFFTRFSSGEFSDAVLTQAARSGTMYQELCKIIAAVLQMMAYTVAAFLISWWVALGALLGGLLITPLARFFFARTWTSGRAQTISSKLLSSRLIDLLHGLKPVKAMAKEDLVWPLLRKETENWRDARKGQILAGASLRAFHEPVLTLFLAGGLYLAIGPADQPLSSTIVLAFIFYRLFIHIGTLQTRYQLVLAGLSAFQSLEELTDDAGREEERHPGTRKFDSLKDAVHLDRVAFSYGNLRILDNVTESFPAGSFTAVYGESGTGKTTLADLIGGLLRPDSGEVYVDGIPLREIEMRSWRRRIGYVPQEILLFNESILTNVTLGDPAFGRDDAQLALRMAGAWDFVMEKEEGLDHPIGERGGTLSGGQRQRIAIARALVGNPSLLILDEATTALDPVTEASICESLEQLRGEVTILAISHQPAMRDIADRVLLMKNAGLFPMGEGRPVQSR